MTVAAAGYPRNSSLQRTTEGRYENRDLKTGALLGVETFRLNVYADGSRCMLIWSNSASRGTQISSNVCVDASFRPTDAHARYWINGAYRGSAWVSVTGRELTMVSTTGGPVTTKTVEVPQRFSIGTHPISGDAWHVAALSDPKASTATSFTFNPAGDRSQPLTGSLVSMAVERAANERVTVPAGTFDAQRIRLSGGTGYWVIGEDWIVVKSGGGSSERVLVALEAHPRP